MSLDRLKKPNLVPLFSGFGEGCILGSESLARSGVMPLRAGEADGLLGLGDGFLDDDFLEERFGKWGLALAGKSRGEDAGGWFDTEVGADLDAKSISHEHTYNEDTADVGQLESTLMRLSERSLEAVKVL